MSKRGKKGQFYIIAAVIISVVLISLFFISQYAKSKPKNVAFYDLSKELRTESGYVIDHGIYSGKDVTDLLDIWLQKYVEYSKTVTGVGDWIFVYGDKEKINIIRFAEESAGSVYIEIGGSYAGVVVLGSKIDKSSATSLEDVKVVVSEGLEYKINLNPGENFFFVISKEGYVSVPGLSPEEKAG